MRPDVVEQLFVQSRGGRLEVLVVLEDPAGGRLRERLLAPTAEPGAAIRFVARRLAERGIRAAPRARLRVTRGGALEDDRALLERFLRELRLARGEEDGWG